MMNESCLEALALRRTDRDEVSPDVRLVPVGVEHGGQLGVTRPGQPHPVGAARRQPDVVHEAGQVLHERLNGAELRGRLTDPRSVGYGPFQKKNMSMEVLID